MISIVFSCGVGGGRWYWIGAGAGVGVGADCGGGDGVCDLCGSALVNGSCMYVGIGG